MEIRKESRSCWMVRLKGEINLNMNSENCKQMGTSVNLTENFCVLVVEVLAENAGSLCRF